MNEIQITKEAFDTLLPIVEKYGKPAVTLILGLTGMKLIGDIANEVIKEKIPMTASFMGFSLSLNQTVNAETN